MIERLIEYREAQQFRKDRKRRQDQKRALMVLFPFLGLLLLVGGIAALVEEEKPVSAVQAVATPSQVSAPDEQEYTAKQEKFCLEVAQMKGLKEPGVTERVEACLVETEGWPMEDFE